MVYRDLGAGPKVVWREGDVAEGTAVFTDSFDVGISDGGRVVIDAQVTGPDVDASNFRALFWIDLAGEPHRLLRYGDAIEVAPGDSRIVTEHWVAGVTVHRQAGRGNGMNETRVATRVRFDDGSQAVLLVPEPRANVATSAALAALSSLVAAPRRTRRRWWSSAISRAG